MENTRFAELATELIGAKAAAEFLKEAWAMADDETKRELASAVVTRVRQLIEEDSFEYRDQFKSIIRDLIEKEVVAEIAKCKESDAQWIENQVGTRVHRFTEEVVDSIVSKAVLQITDKVRDAISSALRGVR